MARHPPPTQVHALLKELIDEDTFHAHLDTQDHLAPARPRIFVRNDGESRRELTRRAFLAIIDEAGIDETTLSDETRTIIWMLCH